MVDEELRAFVLSRPGVEAEIDNRFFPAPLPQAAELPAATYADISAVPGYTNEGETNEVARYQIDTWANERETAVRVAGLIRNILAGFSGKMGGCTIGAVFRQNTFSRYEPDVKLWRIISDYELHIM
jgi:hypothetical protein